MKTAYSVLAVVIAEFPFRFKLWKKRECLIQLCSMLCTIWLLKKIIKRKAIKYNISKLIEKDCVIESQYLEEN